LLSFWVSCVPKANDEQVVVKFALPQNAKSLSVGQLAVCGLDTSFVGAYNSTTGEASIANVAATADPALFTGLGSGQSVLTFSKSPELVISAGAGWNFYYLSSFGLTNCTSGNTIVSYGEKLDQNLNADATVDLNVVSAADHVQQSRSGALPAAFSNVTFQWRSTGSMACSSSGTIHLTLPRALGKSVTTSTGVPYTVSGTIGSVDLVLGPLPKNIEYTAEVRQTSPSIATYTFDFNTKNSVGLTNIDVAVPSSASGICQSVVSGAPAAPTGFTATATSESQINLAWTDNATNENGYKIERSLDNSTWSALTTTAANVQTYSNTGLSASTLYYYRISATNGSGDSATVTANATTTAVTVPTAPSGLAAVATSSSSINLTWLERSLDGVTYSPLVSNAANNGAYSNTGLASATLYYYRVKSRNTAGSSAYSSVASATTNSVSVPSAPTTLVVTPGGGGSASLMWTDNSSDETGFEVERSDTGGGVGFTQVGTTPADTAVYSDFTTMMGNTYYYRVRAVNGGTPSSYTSEFQINL
jgi:hypothetical protein